MAFIKEIVYAEEVSIKTGDYQYTKPKVMMTAILEEGDSHKKVMKGLIKDVKSTLQEIKDGIYEN